jgi:hypothetical protein
LSSVFHPTELFSVFSFLQTFYSTHAVDVRRAVSIINHGFYHEPVVLPFRSCHEDFSKLLGSPFTCFLCCLPTRLFCGGFSLIFFYLEALKMHADVRRIFLRHCRPSNYSLQHKKSTVKSGVIPVKQTALALHIPPPHTRNSFSAVLLRPCLSSPLPPMCRLTVETSRKSGEISTFRASSRRDASMRCRQGWNLVQVETQFTPYWVHIEKERGRKGECLMVRPDTTDLLPLMFCEDSSRHLKSAERTDSWGVGTRMLRYGGSENPLARYFPRIFARSFAPAAEYVSRN